MQNNFQVHISSGHVSLIKRNVPAVIAANRHTHTHTVIFLRICRSVSSSSPNHSHSGNVPKASNFIDSDLDYSQSHMLCPYQCFLVGEMFFWLNESHAYMDIDFGLWLNYYHRNEHLNS